MSMAEKVVGLISTIYPQMKGTGIADRILELEKEYGKLDTTIVFKIAEEVAKQKFCKFKDLLEAMDAGIRIGFAYATLGVVSSPIEGFTGLKIKKTRELSPVSREVTKLMGSNLLEKIITKKKEVISHRA